MKTAPTIQMYMALVVQTVEAGETLKTAEEMMTRKAIRHLPVMQKGQVIGIVSDRDVKLAGSIMGSEADKLPVIDVCNQNPYKVRVDAPVGEVAAKMAEKHYGSVLVMDGEKLVGIFTTVDACRVLADLIKLKF